jgi:hypothetical protein
MRAWLLFVAGCGSASPHVVSSSSHDPESCGFTEFAAFDAASWKAAQNYTHGAPIVVGSCQLHAIDVQITRYVVRAGKRDIAQITMEGTLLLVAGLPVDGFEVGTSSDRVLERHPPDRFRISCTATALGNMCGFRPAFTDEEPKLQFVVDGSLRARLDGIAAYEFFRGKPIRGVQLITRM